MMLVIDYVNLYCFWESKFLLYLYTNNTNKNNKNNNNNRNNNNYCYSFLIC